MEALGDPRETVTLPAVTERNRDRNHIGPLPTWNAIEVAYTYTVLPNGALRVAYVITPKVELEWLPEIGLELKTAGALRNVSWLGLGPGDSLPNRKASVLFGNWTASTSSPQFSGTKSGLEWAHFDFDNGVMLRVGKAAGFRIVGFVGAEQRLRLLSHLAGAWTKNGPAERPEWRLEVKAGETFEGTIEIEPSVVLMK